MLIYFQPFRLLVILWHFLMWYLNCEKKRNNVFVTQYGYQETLFLLMEVLKLRKIIWWNPEMPGKTFLLNQTVYSLITWYISLLLFSCVNSSLCMKWPHLLITLGHTKNTKAPENDDTLSDSQYQNASLQPTLPNLNSMKAPGDQSCPVISIDMVHWSQGSKLLPMMKVQSSGEDSQ